MSPSLSVSACVRAGLALAGAALALTGCAGGAAQSTRPAASVRSVPGDVTFSYANETRPAGLPSPRSSPAMAYDAARPESLLFGGEGSSDMWAWNGHRWAQLHPVHSPGPRAWAEMAYDPRHRQVVLFGGSARGSRLNDTWLWNGRDWTRATPAFTPAPTIEEGITFFSGTGTVLMFSGDDIGPNHLYSWDGADWTDLPFTGGPPRSAFQGGFSVDPKRRVVVLLADDINKTTLQHWEFDGRVWTHRDVATPPVRALVQTADDERTHTIVMFGGVGHNDTWTWDGTRWTQRHPLHSPSMRSSTGPMPGMAYDAARGRVVVFGGIDVRTNRPLNDTWTWNGEDWSQVPPEGSR